MSSDPERERAKVLAKFCDVCQGYGTYIWPSTTMGGGIGGQAMTEGPCPGKARSAMTSMCPVYLRKRVNEFDAEVMALRARVSELEAELRNELPGLRQSLNYLNGVIITNEGITPETRQVIDNAHARLDAAAAVLASDEPERP